MATPRSARLTAPIAATDSTVRAERAVEVVGCRVHAAPMVDKVTGA